ncbi:hypothetical protein AV530_011000 [Patagioenas fasciata monilis]|uniref:Uncharacterized protein n=1 Tax=Patagioenas fasciata monilis TaxID=372326 RepID=A0A1V4JTR2_PATFA|nr:hypothetical protein AV530_011000 [Patagioenas fasciata monilis]
MDPNRQLFGGEAVGRGAASPLVPSRASSVFRDPEYLRCLCSAEQPGLRLELKLGKPKVGAGAKGCSSRFGEVPSAC